MCQKAYEFLFPVKQDGKRSLREGSITALFPGPNRTGKSTLMNDLPQYMADTQNATVFFIMIDAKTLNEIRLSVKPDNDGGKAEQSSKITEIMIRAFEGLHAIAKKYTEETGKKAIFLPCIDEVDNKDNDPELPVIINLPSVIAFYDKLFPTDRTATQNNKNKLTSHFFLAANNPDQVSINCELVNQGKTNHMNTFLLRIKNLLNFEYSITEKEVQRAALCVITNKQVFEKELDNELKKLQGNDTNIEHKAKLEKVMKEFTKIKVEAMERTKKALEKAYPEYVKKLMESFDSLCNLTTRRENVYKFLDYDGELTEFNYQHFNINGDISKKKTGRNAYFDETIDGILKCINIPSLSLDQILGAINNPSCDLQDTEISQRAMSDNPTTTQ